MGLFFLTSLIACGVVCDHLGTIKLNAQMQAIAIQISNRDADSVHDVTHPVFSVQQLLRACQQFQTEYRRRLNVKLSCTTAPTGVRRAKCRRVFTLTEHYARLQSARPM